MPGKKGPGTRGPRNAPQPNDGAMLFDRRLMERHMVAIERLLQEHDFETIEEANAFLQEALASGPLPEVVPETPLEQAQAIVYQAMEATGKRRVTLARKALEASPDCVDAYVLLAESAKSPKEARGYYQQGVEAGERSLGEDVFRELAGNFWEVVETRPYMRARYGLAILEWVSGESDAAISDARELLRLDTNDHQGVRDLLINWLFTMEDEPGVGALLAQYLDDWSATWAYSTLLHTYRTQGPGKAADEAFIHAMEVNPFVPLYLLGVIAPPKQAPEFYGMGDENEAVIYVAQAAEVWITSPDLLEWIADALIRLAPVKQPARKKSAPAGKATPRKRTATGSKQTKPRASGPRASGKRSGGNWVKDTPSTPATGAPVVPPQPPDAAP